MCLASDFLRICLDCYKKQGWLSDVFAALLRDYCEVPEWSWNCETGCSSPTVFMVRETVVRSQIFTDELVAVPFYQHAITLGRKPSERFVDFERDPWGNKGVSSSCVSSSTSCHWIFPFKPEKAIASSSSAECPPSSSQDQTPPLPFMDGSGARFQLVAFALRLVAYPEQTQWWGSSYSHNSPKYICHVDQTVDGHRWIYSLQFLSRYKCGIAAN